MLVARHQKIAAKIEHQRSLLENLARKLKIITLDDWYNVTTVEITNIGGRGFDLLKGLQTVYPEHDWKPWKFKYVSWGYWNDSSTHRQYFDWLGKQLNVTQVCYSLHSIKLLNIEHSFYSLSTGIGLL